MIILLQVVRRRKKKEIVMHFIRAIWRVNNYVFKVLWSTKMTWAIWLAISKLHSIYRLSVVKSENNNFIKEIKYFLLAFIAWWKPRQSLWKFLSRWKPSTGSRVFTDLFSNSPKGSPRFSPRYEGTENMFYFLNIYNAISAIPL